MLLQEALRCPAGKTVACLLERSSSAFIGVWVRAAGNPTVRCQPLKRRVASCCRAGSIINGPSPLRRGANQLLSDSKLQIIETVRASLCKSGQRELPYAFLYDEIGSALFEVITLLPEYGLTRAETRLLGDHAAAIAGFFSSPVSVAELGSGTGTKTRLVLEAARSRGPVRYYPIDLSAYALDGCEQVLSDLPEVSIIRLNRSYLEGLAEAVSLRKPNEALLILFLGSTIGNLQPPEADSMLLTIRRLLQPGDAFLLGADIEKEIDRMLLAYDDPLGVTAAFNLNLLGHVNRLLGADFDRKAFTHEARYNQDAHRIEMHLRSRKRQIVNIRAGNFSVCLHENETIWTESSYKYEPQELLRMARRAGFEPVEQWRDQEWPFALNLWGAV